MNHVSTLSESTVTLSASLVIAASLSSSNCPVNATQNAADNISAKRLKSTGDSLFSRKNTSVHRSDLERPL